MTHCKTLCYARLLARRTGGTYRKVEGGWLVMSWADYAVWKKQK